MSRPPLRRIVVLDDFGDAVRGAADWSGLPVEIQRDHLPDDALVERLAGADAVVLIRERTALRAGLINRLPALRLVVTAGMRNRVLDLEACTTRGIAVCGTDSLASPTVELTWGLILALARQIPRQERSLRRGGWQQGAGLGLEGATLGVAGLGRIGAGVAAIDTHDPEPMAADDPIRRAPDTILTPHLGYVTRQNFRRYFEGATDCLRAWDLGQPLPRPLNATAQASRGAIA